MIGVRIQSSWDGTLVRALGHKTKVYVQAAERGDLALPEGSERFE